MNATTSPAASPSGDLLAAFSSIEGEADVVLFDNNSRTLYKNLTKGFGSDFQYFVAQEQTLGRKMGRDIDFSPDGNLLAFFARKEGGRHLVLMDVLKGKVSRQIPPDNVEQQIAPAFSPDGRKVAFSAHRDGKFDIFELNLETGVTESTRDIFLESAFFSPTSLIGQARLYGLHTDASHRFERGVDPELQRRAAERATGLLLEIVGGRHMDFSQHPEGR